EEKTGTCTFAALTFWYSSIVIILTLAAISFDRFLFIVKPLLHKRFMRPWVALTLTIVIWILSAVLSCTPFYGLGNFGFTASIGLCIPLLVKGGFVILAFTILILSLLIIVITSLWTFFFTWWFLRKRSMVVESNIYSSKKRGLLGIFGFMLLVYGISKGPRIIALVLVQFEVPFSSTSQIVIYFVYQLSIIGDPIVQSFFRPGLKQAMVSLFKNCKK
uniref:G-protein coupled receptors family 1 profile domain-containing protein n=1 Tax=Amphimedon queenslandica TaxID=400682 RepID=A0A1X7TTT3_AMPQE